MIKTKIPNACSLDGSVPSALSNVPETPSISVQFDISDFPQHYTTGRHKLMVSRNVTPTGDHKRSLPESKMKATLLTKCRITQPPCPGAFAETT